MQDADTADSEDMTDAFVQGAMMEQNGDDGDTALVMRGFFRRLGRRIGQFVRNRPGLVSRGIRWLASRG